MISIIYTIGFLVTLVYNILCIKLPDKDGTVAVTVQDLIWCIIFAALWWILVPIIMFWGFLKFVAKILSK